MNSFVWILYFLIVSNRICALESNEAVDYGLDYEWPEIDPEPLTVAIPNEWYIVNQNTDFNVTCEVSRNGIAVTWNKMYEKSLGSNVQQLGNTLNIVNFKPENRGVYQCFVDSSIEIRGDYTVIDMNPLEVPKIEIYPLGPQVVPEGEDVLLKCRAIAGAPTPNLKWVRRDRLPLPLLTQEKAPGTILIPNIAAFHAGEYECQALNDLGVANMTTSIVVQAPNMDIDIVPNLPEITVTEGENLVLFCNSKEPTLPMVKWRAPIYAEPLKYIFKNSQMLKIFHVKRSDEGLYVCKAYNSSTTLGRVHQKHIKVSVRTKDFTVLTSGGGKRSFEGVACLVCSILIIFMVF